MSNIYDQSYNLKCIIRQKLQIVIQNIVKYSILYTKFEIKPNKIYTYMSWKFLIYAIEDAK